MTLSLDPYPIAGRMHLPTKAYVKPISDGRYTIIGPMIAGMWFDMGPAVGLSNGGVDVSVISQLRVRSVILTLRQSRCPGI